jgi:GT2 family glycosyltransferase
VSLCVTITTFNGRAVLERTLPSVLASRLTRPVRYVVVDDGSSDGTLEWLAAEHPEIEIVDHGHNRGVAAAMNSALRAGLASDYVALLNNDVELTPDALEILCRSLEREERASGASPKMLNYYDRSILDGAGDLYGWIGWGRRRGRGQRDLDQFPAGPVFGVCAGAAVLRSAAVRDVGFFDERFFAYYEDVDWAIRANLLGHRFRYEPSAVVFHMDGATTGRGLSEFHAYHSWRNAIWVVAKNWSAGELLRHGWLFTIGQALTGVVAARHGLLRVWLRACGDALAAVRALRRTPSPRRITGSLDLPAIGADLRTLRGGK